MTELKAMVEDKEAIAEPKEEYTISQLIDLHDDLEDDVECLDRLLGQALSKGVMTLLDGHRCESARKLKRIHDLFDETRLAI